MVSQGGARSSLALGYYHVIPTGFQFGSLCSRIDEEPRPNRAVPARVGLDHLTIASGILLQQKAEQPERDARRRRQNDEQSDNLRRAGHYGNSIDVTLLRQVVSS